LKGSIRLRRSTEDSGHTGAASWRRTGRNRQCWPRRRAPSCAGALPTLVSFQGVERQSGSGSQDVAVGRVTRKLHGRRAARERAGTDARGSRGAIRRVEPHDAARHRQRAKSNPADSRIDKPAPGVVRLWSAVLISSVRRGHRCVPARLLNGLRVSRTVRSHASAGATDVRANVRRCSRKERAVRQRKPCSLASYVMAKSHEPVIERCPDGQWIVRCRECEQRKDIPLPIGLGTPIANRHEAEMILANHRRRAA
jgi:hypothetical protein